MRCPSLCRGYWGPPGHEHLDADGWFATGDLASLSEDGYVSIRGRRTELIITGGHNVYPAEVEAVLARHPGVAEVAVVGVPDPEWGETVVAFVVGDPDIESLQRLAAPSWRPSNGPVTCAWSMRCHATPWAKSCAPSCTERATLRPRPTAAQELA